MVSYPELCECPERGSLLSLCLQVLGSLLPCIGDVWCSCDACVDGYHVIVPYVGDLVISTDLLPSSIVYRCRWGKGPGYYSVFCVLFW